MRQAKKWRTGNKEIKSALATQRPKNARSRVSMRSNHSLANYSLSDVLWNPTNNPWIIVSQGKRLHSDYMVCRRYCHLRVIGQTSKERDCAQSKKGEEKGVWRLLMFGKIVREFLRHCYQVKLQRSKLVSAGKNMAASINRQKAEVIEIRSQNKIMRKEIWTKGVDSLHARFVQGEKGSILARGG